LTAVIEHATTRYMTPRDLVYKTLEFENFTSRPPHQLWVLPWAEHHFKGDLDAIRRDFPDDIIVAEAALSEKGVAQGNPYEVGESVDPWGCRFTNIQRGVHGEVKNPIVSPDDEDWEDTRAVHFPREWLSFNINEVNRFCAETDRFVLAGVCPRPFEQLQFIRGTEQLLIDLALKPPGLFSFINKMHEFYCEVLTKWAKTDVDALNIMDDWGTQRGLLIHPDTWTALFKPLYKDYIEIAHRHGKKMFMHSDGHTLAIYPHLIELGLDAFNSQIFCIGLDQLTPFKGKITFWGEIDRQHLLPFGSPRDIDEAVRAIRQALWHNGGCIAQCEAGPGAQAANIRQVFASWASSS